MLEPVQVLDGQLAERDAAPATLLGTALKQRLLGVLPADKHQHPLRSHRLDEHPVRGTATPTTPSAVPIRFHPGTTKRADDRLAVA
jgi:hypothetical protein